MVKRSKILACLMASVLLLGNALPVFAQDIELSGDSAIGSTPSSFTVDADYLGGGVVVVIPATLDLTVDDDTGDYSANDVVSAKGNMNPSKVLKVSTNTEIEYINTDDNSVTATGTVIFGTDGTEQWTAAQTKASLTSLDSRAIDVAVAKDALPYTGEYTSIVYFNIEAVSNEVDDAVLAVNFKWETDDASATVTGLEDGVAETNLVIPATYNDLPVKAIGSTAFGYNANITSVEIADSVETIGYRAFVDCFGLTSVTIPNSVTTIDENAFSDCNSLTSVEIPDSVTTLGRSAFSGCDGLESVIIPNSITALEPYTFFDCTVLATVTYDGVDYTSLTDFTAAFEAAGGTVDNTAFNDTAFAQ